MQNLFLGQKVVGFTRAKSMKESPRQAGSKPVNQNKESAGESGMKQQSGKAWTDSRGLNPGWERATGEKGEAKSGGCGGGAWQREGD